MPEMKCWPVEPPYESITCFWKIESVVHMHVVLAHVKKILCEGQRKEMYVKGSLPFQEERALQITCVPSVKQGGGREK